MVAARALSAFYERERDKGAPSARYRAGALLIAEAFDDLRIVGRFIEVLGKKKR